MKNRLVYISGNPFWMTPEGSFTEAEMNNGIPVEHVMYQTSSD
jgi:hypothetical protein